MSVDDEDWKRIQRLDRYPEIKTQDDYKRGVVGGMSDFRDAFAGEPGVLRPNDILDGHKFIFGRVHPWAGELRNEPVIFLDKIVEAENLPEKMQGILEGQIAHKKSEMTQEGACKLIAEVYCKVVTEQFFLDGNKRLADSLCKHQMTAEFGEHPWPEIKEDALLRAVREFKHNGKTDVMTGLIEDRLSLGRRLTEDAIAESFKDGVTKDQVEQDQKKRAVQKLKELEEIQLKMKQAKKQKP